ncbi:MAG: pantetheine-phosphate adenylyltransferase [bacterium]|nr:pantetheine-phosphate adenylyltransferase [bacterium]
MHRAIYPGSFDPLTNGHLDIIVRAATIVDELIVAVVHNPNKHPLFTLEEREAMLGESLAGLNNVKTAHFSGLLVDFVKEMDASIIVRGLRAVSDFEIEFQMALVNKKLAPGVETMFLMTTAEHAFLSSSSIKEIASLGGDISDFVPPVVKARLLERYKVKK